MVTRVKAFALVAAAGMIAGCSDRPTEPKAINPNQQSTSMNRDHSGKAAERAALLTDIPVSGTLEGGGTFSGTLTATKITVDEATQQLTMTGVLNGTAIKGTGAVVDVVNQTFSAPLSISRPGASTTSSFIQPVARASCGILNLVLGPLHLDLLGLVVNLNQVVLNITGATGAGNLLGNLLCGLTGLLDIPGALASISHILQSINNILSGLTVPGIGGVMWSAPQPTLHVWSA